MLRVYINTNEPQKITRKLLTSSRNKLADCWKYIKGKNSSLSFNETKQNKGKKQAKLNIELLMHTLTHCAISFRIRRF